MLAPLRFFSRPSFLARRFRSAPRAASVRRRRAARDGRTAGRRPASLRALPFCSMLVFCTLPSALRSAVCLRSLRSVAAGRRTASMPAADWLSVHASWRHPAASGRRIQRRLCSTRFAASASMQRYWGRIPAAPVEFSRFAPYQRRLQPSFLPPHFYYF